MIGACPRGQLEECLVKLLASRPRLRDFFDDVRRHLETCLAGKGLPFKLKLETDAITDKRVPFWELAQSTDIRIPKDVLDGGYVCEDSEQESDSDNDYLIGAW